MLKPLRSFRPLLALLLAALALPAAATTVARLSPEQVDALAHRIVEARVVAAHDVQVPGTEILATEYELAVERVIKDDGTVAPALLRGNGILVIRQIGGSAPEARISRIPGMPAYRLGDRLRLALNGDSTLGLTSPVGLGQGVQRLPDMPAAAAAGATP